jgi:copper resistance protein D
VLLPGATDDASFTGRMVADYLKSLSNWAAVALTAILATGVYNSYRVLGSVRDLIESDYGHVLVFKLCFVLVGIALGAVNRFYGLPAILSLAATQMNARHALLRVIRILRIESIALLLVTVAAGLLTSSAPPGG